MKNILEPLKVSHLTNVEAGELIVRNVDDITTLGTTLVVDPVVKTYQTGLTTRLAVYKKALAQLTENADSKKIELADDTRDKAVSALVKAIKLGAESDVASEVEAARVLTVLANKYKGITELNYESETLKIDLWVADLETATYSKLVTALGITRYVTRLKAANVAFKTLFGGRSTTTALTTHYDTKALRSDLFAYYREFTLYIQSMANATNTAQYLKILSMLNSGRKYYANQLERREGVKAAADAAKKAEETSTEK